MITNNLTVSVVIVAYNEEHSIARCLNSLLSQIEEIDEIIVVDNNSTDKTSDVVKAMNIEKCRVITEKRQGVIFARATGFNAASKDLILRIDADSYADDDWVCSAKAFFASASDEVWAARGSVVYYDLPFPNITPLIDELFINGLNTNKYGYTLYGCNMAIRRVAWGQIRNDLSTTNDVMEDVDMSLAIRERGRKVAYLKNMRATSSGRRIASPPRKFWKYNAMWPRTYFARSMRLQGIAAYINMIGANTAQLFAYIGLLFWNPRTGSFTLRPSSRRYEDRKLP